MTLNTRVHIAKPIHAEALFKHILAVLESDPRFDGKKATWREVRKGEQVGPFKVVMRESGFCTTLGQGLAAIWEVEYGSDGPMKYYNTGELADDPEIAGPYNTHFVSASFDTGYGYRAPNGANCADLHAFLLREIRTYLDDLGVTEWAWQHEEEGTWHEPDQYPLRGDAELGGWDWKKKVDR